MSDHPPPSADAIVVYAGLAGLICARDLHHHGLNVVVLEARDRVDGPLNSTWHASRLCSSTRCMASSSSCRIASSGTGPPARSRMRASTPPIASVRRVSSVPAWRSAPPPVTAGRLSGSRP
ncbi:FAD-dependent oxidoreductase [Nonomuraea mangrovi]|uniref:FAD-dependent oxidoreductase n=1 Tax=Nonomuraea mangrovi TaxID=2316207 RepID=A0ABW4TAN0_9ACTN